MNRRQMIALVGAVALIAAAAIILYFRLTSVRQQLPEVRVGYLNITASVPFFIAEQEGFFAQEGVRIDGHQIATSNQLVDAVVAGNLDAFVEASAVPVLAVEQQSHGKLKIFAASSITAEAPFDAILVKQGATLRNLDDLSGKKIGRLPRIDRNRFVEKIPRQ